MQRYVGIESNFSFLHSRFYGFLLLIQFTFSICFTFVWIRLVLIFYDVMEFLVI